MSHEVGMFELVLTGGGAAGGIGAAWIHMKVTVAGLKKDLEHFKEKLDEEKESNKENYKEIKENLGSIFKKLTEMSVLIAKKK